jgi:hypothetical protein
MTTYTRSQAHTAVGQGIELAAAESGLDCDAARFTWATAAILTVLDNPRAAWADVEARHAQLQHDEHAREVADGDTQVTRDQVSKAVNDGIDWAAEKVRGRAADDIDNLAVNAVLTLLEDPAASFEDIVASCYGEDPAVVGRWLADAAATEKVLALFAD